VEPDHVPVDAESVCPTVGVPEIDGGADDVGGCGGGGGAGGAGAVFETLIVTVDVPVDLPFFEYALAVNWCVPSESVVVFRPPATPL
jgi:hypothetical protein